MSSQGASGTDTGEKQVKFSLPKSGVGKVFSRSCSTAGVFKTSNTNSKSSATPLMSDRSLSGERHELNDIPEGKAIVSEKEENPEEAAEKAKAKRAAMVKKALRYFEDKSNRTQSEDNLFTRRKNLAVHLGLDENVSLREIQKINTYSLPVPSSATPFNPVTNAAAAREIVVVEEEEEVDEVEEDLKTKDLVRFLGMKDGVTASMASQGRLSEDQGCANNAQQLQLGHATSSGASNSTCSSASVTVNSMPPPSISKIRSASLEKSPSLLAKVREDSLDKKS